jgi:RNA polymerase sigma-70 factor (ECF subfamily)
VVQAGELVLNMAPVKAGKSGDNANAAEVLLLRRIADDDREAFVELFENYHPRLFTFLFRLTRSHGSAEELANDVLLTLWKSAGRFRGESKVSTWVFGIAYRQALTHIRKRKLKLVLFGDNDKAAQAASSIEPNDRLEREDWVRRGIDELPPKQKLTVMLVYFLGLSCEETSSVTGVPTSTVKTRMFHARRKMKQHLVASSVPQHWEEGSGSEQK